MSEDTKINVTNEGWRIVWPREYFGLWWAWFRRWFLQIFLLVLIPAALVFTLLRIGWPLPVGDREFYFRALGTGFQFVGFLVLIRLLDLRLDLRLLVCLMSIPLLPLKRKQVHHRSSRVVASSSMTAKGYKTTTLRGTVNDKLEQLKREHDDHLNEYRRDMKEIKETIRLGQEEQGRSTDHKVRTITKRIYDFEDSLRGKVLPEFLAILLFITGLIMTGFAPELANW